MNNHFELKSASETTQPMRRGIRDFAVHQRLILDPARDIMKGGMDPNQAGPSEVQGNYIDEYRARTKEIETLCQQSGHNDHRLINKMRDASYQRYTLGDPNTKLALHDFTYTAPQNIVRNGEIVGQRPGNRESLVPVDDPGYLERHQALIRQWDSKYNRARDKFKKEMGIE